MEKYVGTLVTQKAYIKDFLDERQIINAGELPREVFQKHYVVIIKLNVSTCVQEKK